jgi:hypothetical protein
VGRLEGDAHRRTTVTRITSREAARIIGVKTATLANWRCVGDGPSGWLRLAPTVVVYDRDAVEAWVRERSEAVARHFAIVAERKAEVAASREAGR